MSVIDGADNRQSTRGRTGQLRELAGRAVASLSDVIREASFRDWLRALSVLAAVALFVILYRQPEPNVDLTVTWISIDPVDSTTTGCTVGPRVQVLARVQNRGNVTLEDGEALVRFVGQPDAGTDADVLTIDLPLRSISTSRRTNEAMVGRIITLPEVFLDRPSSWTTTVIHADGANLKDTTVREMTLDPCSGRSDAP